MQTCGLAGIPRSMRKFQNRFLATVGSQYNMKTKERKLKVPQEPIITNTSKHLGSAVKFIIIHISHVQNTPSSSFSSLSSLPSQTCRESPFRPFPRSDCEPEPSVFFASHSRMFCRCFPFPPSREDRKSIATHFATPQMATPNLYCWLSFSPKGTKLF